MASRFDLAIVGGGPTGLAVAIEARIRGLDAVLFDRRRPPIDKACGEGLMPAALDALERLGVEPSELPGRPYRGLRYVDASGEIEAFAPLPGRPGRGVRRTVLHEHLARRAAEAGAELRWGARVTGLFSGGVVLEGGETVRARWIVGADGLHSRVRRWAGLAARRRRRRYGRRVHYEIEPWTDAVEVHWGEGGEAYVTPVGPRCVGVALLTDRPHRGGNPHEGFLRLERRLAGARALSEPRGAGPFDLRVPRVVRGPVLLAGDAAGYSDPITGEGLGLGLAQARALVAAVADGRPQAYRAAHARIVRPHERVVRALLAVRRRPALRRRLLGAIARRPDLFRELVRGHLEAPGGVVRLAAGLARALLS